MKKSGVELDEPVLCCTRACTSSNVLWVNSSLVFYSLTLFSLALSLFVSMYLSLSLSSSLSLPLSLPLPLYSSDLPARFQYFTEGVNPGRKGGALSVADYCPYYSTLSNRICVDPAQAVKASENYGGQMYANEPI